MRGGTSPTRVLCVVRSGLHAFGHAARVYGARPRCTDVRCTRRRACCTRTRLDPTRMLLAQIRWTCCLRVRQRQRCCTHRTRICAVRTRTPQTCYTRALNCTPIYYKPAARICYAHAATVYTLHIHTCCIHVLCRLAYALYAWRINTPVYAAR